jgi:hypothetical protein
MRRLPITSKVQKSRQVHGRCQEGQVMAKTGLYDNINAKRERIKAGSGEKMRKPGTKGAPTAKAFKEAAKTAKPKPKTKTKKK